LSAFRFVLLSLKIAGKVPLFSGFRAAQVMHPPDPSVIFVLITFSKAVAVEQKAGQSLSLIKI